MNFGNIFTIKKHDLKMLVISFLMMKLKNGIMLWVSNILQFIKVEIIFISPLDCDENITIEFGDSL
jgi:hypothetical protein